MATGGSELTSDEVINIKCCVCIEENRKIDADKYCIGCKEYYCSSCVGIHNKFPPTRGHQILNKSDFRSLGSDGSLPSYPTQKCPQHPMDVINMYCKDHDEVACSLCISLAISHRNCVKIVSISEDIENLYQQSDIQDVKEKIIMTKKTLLDVKTTNEIKIQELNKSLEKEIEAVKEVRKELEALLDNMEQETIQILRTEFGKIEASLAGNITEIKRFANALDETNSMLKKAEGNKAQEFVSIKYYTKLAKEQKFDIKQLQGTDESVNFTGDQSIKEFLQQIRVFGKVSKPGITTNTPKCGLYKVKNRREIDVTHENDKKVSYIWGSCITEDGFLLLADYNNKMLKRMDISTEKVKDYTALPGKPQAVCTVSKTEAVVSVGQAVLLVSLGTKMTTTRTLQMDHHCFGLAHLNGKLFVSNWRKTLYIYDLNGHQLSRTTKNACGKDILQENQHIVVSAKGDKVFVTDWYMGLVVFDSQGYHISTQTFTEFTGYQGVCTDGRNLFVTCHSSNKIIQFGEDFRILGEIGDVNGIASMCFDNQQRLIVTQFNSNKCTILELQ